MADTPANPPAAATAPAAATQPAAPADLSTVDGALAYFEAKGVEVTDTVKGVIQDYYTKGKKLVANDNGEIDLKPLLDGAKEKGSDAIKAMNDFGASAKEKIGAAWDAYEPGIMDTIGSFFKGTGGGIAAGILAVLAAMGIGDMGLMGSLLMGAVVFLAVEAMTGNLGNLFGGGSSDKNKDKGDKKTRSTDGPEAAQGKAVEVNAGTVTLNGQDYDMVLHGTSDGTNATMNSGVLVNKKDPTKTIVFEDFTKDQDGNPITQASDRFVLPVVNGVVQKPDKEDLDNLQADAKKWEPALKATEAPPTPETPATPAAGAGKAPTPPITPAAPTASTPPAAAAPAASKIDPNAMDATVGSVRLTDGTDFISKAGKTGDAKIVTIATDTQGASVSGIVVTNNSKQFFAVSQTTTMENGKAVTHKLTPEKYIFVPLDANGSASLADLSKAQQGQEIKTQPVAAKNTDTSLPDFKPNGTYAVPYSGQVSFMLDKNGKLTTQPDQWAMTVEGKLVDDGVNRYVQPDSITLADKGNSISGNNKIAVTGQRLSIGRNGVDFAEAGNAKTLTDFHNQAINAELSKAPRVKVIYDYMDQNNPGHHAVEFDYTSLDSQGAVTTRRIRGTTDVTQPSDAIMHEFGGPVPALGKGTLNITTMSLVNDKGEIIRSIPAPAGTHIDDVPLDKFNHIIARTQKESYFGTDFFGNMDTSKADQIVTGKGLEMDEGFNGGMKSIIKTQESEYRANAALDAQAQQDKLLRSTAVSVLGNAQNKLDAEAKQKLLTGAPGETTSTPATPATPNGTLIAGKGPAVHDTTTPDNINLTSGVPTLFQSLQLALQKYADPSHKVQVGGNPVNILDGNKQVTKSTGVGTPV